MVPYTSPNSSLKNGPRTPAGSVCWISPIFLRTVYQIWPVSLAGEVSLSWKITVVSPGLEKLRILSA
ncbi:hypothetical protein D3C72_2028180 [compost metagenome]